MVTNAKIIALTQARVGSTRFPAKILQKIQGKSLLEIHLERIKKAKYVTQVIVATTNEKGASSIVEIARNAVVEVYQGSLEDVLDRFYQAANEYKPDYIVRLTSDCPLIDPQLIDKAIETIVQQQVEYVSNTLAQEYPDGQDVEVMTFDALEMAWKQSKLLSEREHVTPYIWKNSDFKGGDLFKSINIGSPANYNNVRMTVDEPVDLDAIKVLISKVGVDANWETYTRFILEHADLFSNQGIIRNEGYQKSISKDQSA